MRSPTIAAGTWVVVILLAAPNMRAAERRTLIDHVPAAVTNGRASRTGRLPGSARLDLSIALPLRDLEGLKMLLDLISDPASPEYRHYLSPQQFAERFGPTEEDYRKVIDFAESNGLRVTARTPNRMLVDVSGSVQDTERAFQVTMRLYHDQKANRRFHAPDAEPSVPVDAPVLEIAGLDDFAVPRPIDRRVIASGNLHLDLAGSGPGGSFMGNDFRAAYAPGVTDRKSVV